VCSGSGAATPAVTSRADALAAIDEARTAIMSAMATATALGSAMTFQSSPLTSSTGRIDDTLTRQTSVDITGESSGWCRSTSRRSPQQRSWPSHATCTPVRSVNCSASTDRTRHSAHRSRNVSVRQG
jgi:hypothetical protein